MKTLKTNPTIVNLARCLLFLIFILSVEVGFCQEIISLDFESKPSEVSLGQTYTELTVNSALIVINNVPQEEVEKIAIHSEDSSIQNLISTINLGKQYEPNSKRLVFNLQSLIGSNERMYNLSLKYGGESVSELFSSDNALKISIFIKENSPRNTSLKLNDNEMKDAALQFFKREYNKRKYFNTQLGIYLKDNIVHIFIDQNGNFIETPIPTTSTEKYLYQFHLFYDIAQSKDYTFNFSWEGTYEPRLNIIRGGEEITEVQAYSDLKQVDRVMVHDFEVIGPFTDNFKVKLTRSEGGNTTDLIPERTIPVAKLYHVSISTGLISTTLRNPQNIVQFPLATGDSTLVADDPSLRGVVTLFASYYPKGRSFLLTPSGNLFDPSRFAIQVGAQLNSDLAENFFLGLSHDFARGGSFSYGAHFGRRNYVAGKPDFEFGSEKFDLEQLIIKKDWGIGFYFGVVIDVRVAFQLLGTIGNPQF